MRKTAPYIGVVSAAFTAVLISQPAAAEHNAAAINFAALDSICQKSTAPDDCFDKQFAAAEQLMDLVGHIPYRRKQSLDTCMTIDQSPNFVKVITCYKQQINAYTDQKGNGPQTADW